MTSMVKDAIGSPAVTVAPDDSVEQAANLMHTRVLKRLPVVNAAGNLVGIISRTDVPADPGFFVSPPR